MIFRTAVVGVGCALALSACDCGKVAGGGGGDMDASVDDAGVFVPPDSGTPIVDSGTPVVDAGQGPGELQAAIVDSLGNLVLLRLDGGTSLLVNRVDAGLGPLQNPRWSPDGTRLAFADGNRAYILEADGTLTRPHADRTVTGAYDGQTEHVEWSSDGKRLAIDGVDFATDARSAFVVPADAGLPVFVGFSSRWAWERNSESLLFSKFDLNRSAFVTNRYEYATRDAGFLFDGVVLDVAHDGRAALQRSQSLDGGAPVDLLLLRDPSTAGEALLVPAGSPSINGSDDSLTFSADSLEFAMHASSSAGAGRFVVLRGPVDGGAATTLFDRPAMTGVPLCLRWVPGTPWLSYVVNDPAVALFLADPDGGVTPVSTPALRFGLAGCLDWRLHRD